jgi:iron-sulfur cluster assembly accessory protein
MLTLTEKAAERLQKLRRLKQSKGFLRIMAEKRGGTRWVFQMGFDAQREGDEKTESRGVTVVMDRQTAKALDGVTMDYTQTGGRGTFVFLRDS